MTSQFSFRLHPPPQHQPYGPRATRYRRIAVTTAITLPALHYTVQYTAYTTVAGLSVIYRPTPLPLDVYYHHRVYCCECIYPATLRMRNLFLRLFFFFFPRLYNALYNIIHRIISEMAKQRPNVLCT